MEVIEKIENPFNKFSLERKTRKTQKRAGRFLLKFTEVYSQSQLLWSRRTLKDKNSCKGSRLYLQRGSIKST